MESKENEARQRISCQCWIENRKKSEQCERRWVILPSRRCTMPHRLWIVQNNLSPSSKTHQTTSFKHLSAGWDFRISGRIHMYLALEPGFIIKRLTKIKQNHHYGWTIQSQPTPWLSEPSLPSYHQAGCWNGQGDPNRYHVSRLQWQNPHHNIPERATGSLGEISAKTKRKKT